jgi:hypothetical protein
MSGGGCCGGGSSSGGSGGPPMTEREQLRLFGYAVLWTLGSIAAWWEFDRLVHQVSWAHELGLMTTAHQYMGFAVAAAIIGVVTAAMAIVAFSTAKNDL